MEELIRDAGMIAQEINLIKEQTKKQVLAASIEIGNRLAEAKALVPFGEWEAWLSANVDYSQSTANNLMRIAKEYGSMQADMLSGKAPKDVFANLSYSQAVALLGLPMSERMEMAAQRDLSTMSSREIEEAVRARKAAEERADTLAETLQDERDACAALRAEIEALKEEMAAPSSEQVDMDAYILRAEADAESEKLKAELEKAKEKEKKLKSKMDEARAAGKSDGEAAAAKEMQALRDAVRAAEEKAADAEKKAKAAEDKLARGVSPILSKFALYFEGMKSDFDKVCALLEEADDEERGKIKNGMLRVLDGMREVIGDA